MSSSRSESTGKHDQPPMSRLFIICSRNNSEEDFRRAFEPFGTIEEVYVVRDRATGENKGVCYIKFSKTTEAAHALEAMNGKHISEEPNARPIKVLVASAKSQGSKKFDGEEERYLRLFVLIPREMSEKELDEEFGQYGEVESVTIIRDKATKEGKGFAYIKYRKFSHAAEAFERCPGKYKAVFAEPKPSKAATDPLTFGFGESSPWSNQRDRRMSDDVLNHLPLQDGTLSVICSPMLKQDQLWRLFDIIPGLDYCQIHDGGMRSANATVVYNNLQSATYAREKLHGFEYPPGERLIVKFGFDSHNVPTIPDNIFNFGSSPRDIFCTVTLPPPRPLAPGGSVCAMRCFIVCVNQGLPANILRQAFCRFGDLIEVFLLPNKNCGYALFASEASARKAIETLHGAEVCGVRLKVLEAEEPRDDRRKRFRHDD